MFDIRYPAMFIGLVESCTPLPPFESSQYMKRRCQDPQGHQELSGKSDENKSFKSNQSAPSIYIMKELCFFSLDQWEISIHLLWGKCFYIPHHCDPHLNQTKLNDLLPLTIHGVLDVLDNFFVTRCFFANFANFSSGSELCFCKLSCYLQIDIMDNFFWNFLFHNYFFANLATSSSGLKLCKFFNSASIQFFLANWCSGQ